MFKKLENNRPFAKIALEGFAGDGKSFTATQIAIGIHKLIKSTKPIAIYDTEKAFKALKEQFDNAGVEAVADDENRSLASLSQAIKWCEEGNSDILIIDSITHVWESFVEAYKAEKRRTRLEFQDWGILKPKWKNEFSTPFVQAKVHIIFTGRAGFEYSDEKNQETGKREIFKSGIKMKAETETAFEPDILVLMQKNIDILGDKKSISREATILKDRTTKIDGKTFVNPTFDDFYPAIKTLLNGVLVESFGNDEIPDTFADFEERFSEIGRKKKEAVAEVEGHFNLMGLGTSKEDKQLKAAILNKVFGKTSIEAIDGRTTSVGDMVRGLQIIKKYAERHIEYVNRCLDSETKPDMKEFGTLLQKTIDEITTPERIDVEGI